MGNSLFALVMVRGLIAAALLFGVGCASTKKSKLLSLDGGFIQFQGRMMTLTERDWRRELSAMQKAGMNIVILQHLQQGDTRFIPDSPQASDPTGIILNYADAHGMKVFIGLGNYTGWWNCNQWSNFLASVAEKHMKLADEIWRRYGAHPSFAGWYVPQEMWDGPFTDDQIAVGRHFFRSVGDHCKSLSGSAPKPIAISPYFKARATPEEVEKIYRNFLAGAGVDILMLQDGIGAKGWDDVIEEKTGRYFPAFERACRANHVEFWANIECFQLLGKTSSGVKQLAPAKADRIRRQIAAAAPFVQRCVTFDFYHYMSPYRSEQSKELYEGYLKQRTQN